MLLGKRPRPPIKRTTSMTEFTLDITPVDIVAGGGPNHQPPPPYDLNNIPRSTSASPRINRRNSADHIETAHFLRACHLCNRRLIPGRDIFMYRGDSAFCSLECRQQQMSQDEKKEQCSMISKKQITTSNAPVKILDNSSNVAAV